MARHVENRENLLRDARALLPRVELRTAIDGREAVVFAGFRGDALSLYFDADPAFHFNAVGQLRRAYVDNRLIKADNGRLVSMERVRSDDAVELQSTPLDNDQQQRLLDDVARRLTSLKGALAAGAAAVAGQVPEDGDAVARLAAWLAAHPGPAVAKSARVV